MIGNWLKRKTQLKAVKAGQEDLERFVLSLRGASAEELGTLVALATILRINFRTIGRLPDEALGIGLSLPADRQSEVQLYISEAVRIFQKDKRPSDAGGMMVWLHTLRAYAYPELRLLGREMWGQLHRGFPYVSDALANIETLTGKAVPPDAWTEFDFIPPGLEPTDK